MAIMERQRWDVLARVGFSLAFFLFIFSYALTPIQDPDFWWHLKSGEVMAQNGGLLQSDPFNFTGDGVVSNAEATILKGYWLWQLTAYSLYSLFGFNGIYLLNFLTITAMAGVVFHQMQRLRVGDTLTILLLAVGFYLFSVSYALERPQVISFLFSAILLGQFSRVRDGEKFGLTLPLLMMFWANLHGGFVVGDILLLTFAFGAVIEYRHDLPRLRHIFLWVALGIGASLLNPTGILTFCRLSGASVSGTVIAIREFQSTIIRFQQGHWSDAILWLLIALYCLGIWWSRRIYWPELMVAIFLAYISAKYGRNIGFFSLGMLPVIGWNLQNGWVMRGWRMIPACKYFIVFLMTVFLLWQAGCLWQQGRNKGGDSLFLLDGASSFILSSGIRGKMFNSYEAGGHLLWKLYPAHQVFIDGRGFHPDVFRDWKAITSASLREQGGRQEFELLLDRYGIEYVVQPHIYYDSGRLTPLLKFLLVKPEWIPVYVDPLSYILVRNSPENVAVIERYQMPKAEFCQKIISYLLAHSNAQPEEIIIHISLAEMFIFVGRYAEAEDRLAVIGQLQPDNPDLPALYNQIAVLKMGKKP